MFIYVGGIPCAGKTTIIKSVVELSHKSNFPLQDLGEKEILCQITGTSSAEDYAKLSKKIRAETRKQMVNYLYELDERNLTTIRIRDDHFTAPKENHTYWVRQIEERDKTHILAFVVIVVEPRVILRRRLGRNLISPEPKFFDVNAILRHQKIEVSVASSQANLLQVPLKIIGNEEGKIEQTTTLLFSFIKRVVVRS